MQVIQRSAYSFARHELSLTHNVKILGNLSNSLFYLCNEKHKCRLLCFAYNKREKKPHQSNRKMQLKYP